MPITPTNPTASPPPKPDAIPTRTEIDDVLTQFLHEGCDPLALAERLGISPFHLLDFFDRPEVQERLEKFQSLIARGEHLRESKARAAALTALQRIVEDEDTDPTEKRRAAASILRAITKPRRRNDTTNHPPPETSDDSSDDTEDRAANGPPLVSSQDIQPNSGARSTPSVPPKGATDGCHGRSEAAEGRRAQPVESDQIPPCPRSGATEAPHRTVAHSRSPPVHQGVVSSEDPRTMSSDSRTKQRTDGRSLARTPGRPSRQT